MLPIETLGMNANQWHFLTAPEKYVDASTRTGRPLAPASTRRQFLTARDILARLNGSQGCETRRGILLADDVGLGKTTVAALVAWIVALAGGQRQVRILVPNDVMVRRWEEELLAHVVPLQKCAPLLDVQRRRVKARRVNKLSAGSIQIVKHSYAASDFNLTCDLLIVDEAHRAKGDGSAFSKALKRQKKYARRVLILTATPFSIQINELQGMLKLIGGDDASDAVASFSRALDDLYSGNTARIPEKVKVAERLTQKALAVVNALSGWVIRHGIDDLPREHQAFGGRDDWDIRVPEATSEEVELIIRMDRALRVAKDHGEASTGATNDPRFHVGWRHFDKVRERLKHQALRLVEPAKAIVERQLSAIRKLRRDVGVHSKMAAAVAAVKTTIKSGEKVILFCHHHATAQELTAHLNKELPRQTPPQSPGVTAWRQAWDEVLAPASEERHEDRLRATFIEWLCADLIRSQTWDWLSKRRPDANLAQGLRTTVGRHARRGATIAAAAKALFATLLQSKSSHAVLKKAHDDNDIGYLPGANGSSRVFGVCMPSDDEKKKEEEEEAFLFVHNQQPDTIISIFNSPFGPDVLVVTDKLSEGIDLHRYCRHLIHYELDPSPIRTVQRNGRLRRVKGWAAVTGKPNRFAYPAFRGTRDHQLVQIMKKRIDSFSLLLGGVQGILVDEVVGSEEEWRNEVIARAKARLSAAGRGLRAVCPGTIA